MPTTMTFLFPPSLMATNLKKALLESVGQAVPVNFTKKKFIAAYDNKFQPGTQQYLYIVEDESGEEYSHYATENQQKWLKDLPDGGGIKACIDEKNRLMVTQDAQMSAVAPQKSVSPSPVKQTEAASPERASSTSGYIRRAGFMQQFANTLLTQALMNSDVKDLHKETMQQIADKSYQLAVICSSRCQQEPQ